MDAISLLTDNGLINTSLWVFIFLLKASQQHLTQVTSPLLRATLFASSSENHLFQFSSQRSISPLGPQCQCPYGRWLSHSPMSSCVSLWSNQPHLPHFNFLFPFVPTQTQREPMGQAGPGVCLGRQVPPDPSSKRDRSSLKHSVVSGGRVTKDRCPRPCPSLAQEKEGSPGTNFPSNSSPL